MLSLAGMQQLYSKNPIDAVIINALAAEDYALGQGKEFSPMRLVNRVVEIMNMLDLPEAESYVKELSGE